MCLDKFDNGTEIWSSPVSFFPPAQSTYRNRDHDCQDTRKTTCWCSFPTLYHANKTIFRALPHYLLCFTSKCKKLHLTKIWPYMLNYTASCLIMNMYLLNLLFHQKFYPINLPILLKARPLFQLRQIDSTTKPILSTRIPSRLLAKETLPVSKFPDIPFPQLLSPLDTISNL